MWEYLDSWDFIALFLSLFCLWLARFGAPKIKAMAPDKVDEKALASRAYVGIAVGIFYLGVHYYLIKTML